MADPEQIYQEVLQEEQQKGSPGVIAEARAKAARVRAEHGSPHPKEPKWWPGAQPHLEDGAGPEPEPDEPPEVEVEPTPAATEPAVAETTSHEPQTEQVAAAEATPAPPAGAPTGQTAEEAAAVHGAPAPGAPAPATAAPAAPAAPAPTAPARPTEVPAERRPAGVIHGTTTGTRLRPEDEVTTEAQFEGQQAMYQRRKVIDDLLATGVPAVAADETGTRGSWLVALYVLIPLAALAFLLAQAGGGTAGAGAEGGGEAAAQTGTAEGGGGADVTLVAQNIEFDKNEISLPEGDATIFLDNRDSVQHNVALYENEEDANQQANPLFDGEIIDGGEDITYEFEAPPPGEYVFQCDVHPSMRGTATVG